MPVRLESLLVPVRLGSLLMPVLLESLLMPVRLETLMGPVWLGSLVPVWLLLHCSATVCDYAYHVFSFLLATEFRAQLKRFPHRTKISFV